MNERGRLLAAWAVGLVMLIGGSGVVGYFLADAVRYPSLGRTAIIGAGVMGALVGRRLLLTMLRRFYEIEFPDLFGP